MVYKHRMKNGRIRHYQSRQAYLNSVKGMFANGYQKKNHSRKINKTKAKRQMKHRGIGKVSSVKKKMSCKGCKRKGLKIDKEGRCEVCVEEFKTFKQPEKHKLRAEIIDLGDSYKPNFDDEDLFKIQTLIDEINDPHTANPLTILGAFSNMEEINDIMGGHGVEGLNEQVGDHTIEILYVNMGDTYDTTVIYDELDGRAYIGDWGSYVEDLGEEETPDWDEAMITGED